MTTLGEHSAQSGKKGPEFWKQQARNHYESASSSQELHEICQSHKSVIVTSQKPEILSRRRYKLLYIHPAGSIACSRNSQAFSDVYAVQIL